MLSTMAISTPALLLDTHAFLWWRTNDQALGPSAKQTIAQASSVYVSLASAWETAIKVSIGKLKFDARFEEGILESGFRPLPIEFRHMDFVIDLPKHHRDPFDRMLVAQAMVEGLTIVTSDTKITRYDVATLSCDS